MSALDAIVSTILYLLLGKASNAQELEVVLPRQTYMCLGANPTHPYCT